jgi:uncharacterized protein (DUF433 family)
MATTIVLDDIVKASPDTMSGAPVFRGTRVLAQTLLDYLEAGDSLDVFLVDFPTVRRDQAVHFVELAGKSALAPLRARRARNTRGNRMGHAEA